VSKNSDHSKCATKIVCGNKGIGEKIYRGIPMEAFCEEHIPSYFEKSTQGNCCDRNGAHAVCIKIFKNRTYQKRKYAKTMRKV